MPPEQYKLNWKNYYEILQVSTNAELAVIKAAHNKLAQTYHPDTSKDPEAAVKMTNINEAYEVLSDPNRRSAYDEVFKTKHQGKEAVQTIERETPHAPPKVVEHSLPLEQAFSQMNRDEIEQRLLKQAEDYYDHWAEATGQAFYRLFVDRGMTLTNIKESRDGLLLTVYSAIVRRLGEEPSKELMQLPLQQLPADVQGAVKDGSVDGLTSNIMLRTVDRLWIRHLTIMEDKLHGAGLEAVGGREPLVMYKHVGQAMFDDLLANITHDVVHTIFKVRIEERGKPPQKSPMEQAAQRREGAGVGAKKVGRNEPCPCGSGKKYKKCCGK